MRLTGLRVAVPSSMAFWKMADRVVAVLFIVLGERPDSMPW
jgi:hypothetical protein